LKVKKFVALLLAGVMAISLTACGGNEQEVISPDPVVEAPAPAPEPAPAPVAEVVEVKEASIDFEDGNMGFVAMYLAPANADPSELNIVDWNGSKALEVKNTEGQKPYLAIDIGSVLGDDVANVASIEMTIGSSHNGGFSSIGGRMWAWVNGNINREKFDRFAVFLENKNPNIGYATKLTELFTAGSDNLIVMYIENDNGPTDGNGSVTFYVDNIRLLDGAGNLLKGDTAAQFYASNFAADDALDANLYYLADAIELEGFAGTSGGGWSQAYVDVTDEIKEKLVPGSMIEISYNSSEPVWPGFVGTVYDWQRGFSVWDPMYSEAYVSTDNTVSQWPYEMIASFLGDEWVDELEQIFVEGWNDWEVFSVRIGKAMPIFTLGKQYEIEGFAGTGGGGWSQVYVPLTEEEKALLVPGSVIEISYNCDVPVWLGLNGGEVGWMRAFPGGETDVEIITAGDGIVQYTYEQMEEYYGAGWVDKFEDLFVEGWEEFEVYSVTIGMPFMKGKGMMTEIEGFSGTGGGGWSQVYVDLTDEEKALLVPGSFINIVYDCEIPVWPGISGDVWVRGYDDIEAVNGANGKVQYTYEELALLWDDGFENRTDWTQLFVEGWEEFTVYSVKIGNRYE